jgi:hypothetical protein
LTTRYCQRTFSLGGETWPLDREDGCEAFGLLPLLKDMPETHAAFHSLATSHQWDGLLAGLGSLGLLCLLVSLFLPDDPTHPSKDALFWSGVGGLGASALMGIGLTVHRKIIVSGLISAYNEKHPEQALTLGLRARFFFF